MIFSVCNRSIAVRKRMYFSRRHLPLWPLWSLTSLLSHWTRPLLRRHSQQPLRPSLPSSDTTTTIITTSEQTVSILYWVTKLKNYDDDSSRIIVHHCRESLPSTPSSLTRSPPGLDGDSDIGVADTSASNPAGVIGSPVKGRGGSRPSSHSSVPLF